MPNFDRLTRMASLVEREIALGNYKFEIRGWGCGTTACAIGLAVATGFEGLTIAPCAGNYCPLYQGTFGWDAITSLFDIDIATAMYFFDYSSYPISLYLGPDGAREVVRRIRAFVNVESDHRTINEVIADPRSIIEIRELEEA